MVGKGIAGMVVEGVKVRGDVKPHRISCSEIWGGIQNVDVDACTSALTTSIYSRSCRGGKGGDIYYVSVCDTDRLTRVAIADVVGHGQEVSEISEWVYDALALRMNNPAGNDLLADLNHKISEREWDAITTAAVLSIYREDSNLYVAYAGHPPLLIRRRSESAWHVAGSELLADLPDLPNLPLGVDAGTEFVQDHFPVGSGDRLVVYTDGLTEAPNRQGELFGQERLLQTLQDAGDCDLSSLKRQVLEAVRRHSGGPTSHDDVTLLAIEIR
jgi:phosphoserine phosphatase RsbU/P